MIKKLFTCTLAIVTLSGCSILESSAKDESQSTAIVFRVTKAREHLGHDTEEGTRIHRSWFDGCRGILVNTKEEVVIWWLNNEIQSTPHRFQDGKTYSIQFKGSFEDGVMGYEGKCFRITNIIDMKKAKD